MRDEAMRAKLGSPEGLYQFSSRAVLCPARPIWDVVLRAVLVATLELPVSRTARRFTSAGVGGNGNYVHLDTRNNLSGNLVLCFTAPMEVPL